MKHILQKELLLQKQDYKDKIDKMPIQHQEGLLTMMERGEFTTTKARNTQTVKANLVIFATSNSLKIM